MTKTSSSSLASQWFRAAETVGDFMGIRYGRVSKNGEEADWTSIPHSECDGIGGFVRALRENGAKIDELPETRHPNRGTIGPLWNLWLGRREPGDVADRRDWSSIQGTAETVAWHLFTEAETEEIRKICRDTKVTVNSFLLKHLDSAVRPEIERPEARLTWMVPVNLRGDVRHADETENHVSFIEPRIGPNDAMEKIQQEIRRRLERGEHRAQYLLFNLGKFLNAKAKAQLIARDRVKAAGNIGAFSNLGVWDAEKTIETDDSWLFCPPVVGGQLVAAGCVTFQGRLSLTVQGHPGKALADLWIKRWVEGCLRSSLR